jgi:hypothetical protein
VQGAALAAHRGKQLESFVWLLCGWGSEEVVLLL